MLSTCCRPRLFLAFTFSLLLTQWFANKLSSHNLLVLAAEYKVICEDGDYTNELPIFIDRRTICNYNNEADPVVVYPIEITSPFLQDGNKIEICAKGEYAERFNITKKHGLCLAEPLEITEVSLRLQIIQILKDKPATQSDRRKAINGILLILTIEDCTAANDTVSWQTILVAVLSSICVTLMSSLAIMLILYQQKGLIKSDDDDDRLEDRRYPAHFNDETFINPRRTSSYEFNSISKHSESTLDKQETEEA